MKSLEAFPEIVVIGSANIDLVVPATRVPAPGETVIGGDLQKIPGGKGANQAVAAARLGARVAFVGRVGEDDFGAALRQNLFAAGVDCRYLATSREAVTGVAMIVVAQSGENAICVAPGANACLAPDDVRAAAPLFEHARVCLVQLEIPVATALCAMQLARAYGVEIILDPAPAPSDAPPELFAVDLITPNEGEARQLLGGAHVDDDALAAALMARGATAVALKLGGRGAYVRDSAGAARAAGFAVEVRDTTAAGDAFTAALATARSEGADWRTAARFANAAGALACTVVGAQTSLATRESVERLLAASE